MTTRWYGKVFGFIAGWLLLRHPGGGLLGLLLGHAFDADWFRSRRDTPYRILGITEDATDAEVEQAYRRMISQYHPDKLVGVAEDLRRQAEDKASAINAAYARIQAMRKPPRS